MNSKYKLPRFLFLKSLAKLLLVFLSIAIVLLIALIIVFASQNRLGDEASVKATINFALIMLPVGFFVLCVVSAIVFTFKQSKQLINIQNLSCLESLCDVDVLCVDKIGAITDGSIDVKKVVPLTAIATEQYLAQAISNVLRATNDNDDLAQALRKQFDYELSAGVVKILPSNNQLNYRGATFKGGKTIVIGDPNYLPIKNKVGIIKRCEEHINNGYRILIVAEGKEQINESGYPGELDAIALIILKDHVRDNAFDTFKFFKNNGTIVKVISSDDPYATSVMAAEAGIDNSSKYISLEGVDESALKELVKEYTVFGYASAEQKTAIINILKQENKNVAMISGNDDCISAMKSSNCSIAFIDNSENVQKAADIVLENTSFKPLSTAVNEGNRFINNMQKVTSLCVIKTIFAFVLTISLMIASMVNPDSGVLSLFVFNHFILWDLLVNSVAAFFLIFEKNNKKIEGSFLKNVFKKSIPASIVVIVSTVLMFVLYAMQNNQIINLGVYSLEIASAMSVLCFTVLGLVFFYSICLPLNKRHTTLLAVIIAISVVAIGLAMVITYLTNTPDILLQIPFLDMNGPAYMTTAIISVILSAIYLFINQIVLIQKGEEIEK